MIPNIAKPEENDIPPREFDIKKQNENSFSKGVESISTHSLPSDPFSVGQRFLSLGGKHALRRKSDSLKTVKMDFKRAFRKYAHTWSMHFPAPSWELLVMYTHGFDFPRFLSVFLSLISSESKKRFQSEFLGLMTTVSRHSYSLSCVCSKQHPIHYKDLGLSFTAGLDFSMEIIKSRTLISNLVLVCFIVKNIEVYIRL